MRFYSAAAGSLIALIALFWGVAVYLPLGFLPAEYAMFRTRHDMAATCKIGPVVLLGDSRAAAGFLPSRIDQSTNLALGGSSPVEVFYVSESVLQCKTPPNVAVVSISPELFMKSGYFWDRSGLYGMFNFQQLEEIRRRSRALHDNAIYDPPKLGDWDAMLDNALRSVRFPSFYTSYIVSHLAIGRLSANRQVEAETLAHKGQHGYGNADGSAEIATDAEMKRFVPSPLLNEYFERMLDEYAAHGITVEYIGMPLNAATYDKMDPQVKADFSNYIKKLTASHANFHVVGDPLRPLDNRWFGDSTHLNQRGAELISDQVNEVVHHDGLLVKSEASDTSCESSTAKEQSARPCEIGEMNRPLPATR